MLKVRLAGVFIIAAVVVLAGLVPNSTRAADLVVVDGKPALKFEFGVFERRGVVLADNGTLVVRNDGCWRANMELLNGSGVDRTVSVVVRFSTPRGHHYTSLVLVNNEDVLNTGVLDIESFGCDGSLASAFPNLTNYGVARVFSVY